MSMQQIQVKVSLSQQLNELLQAKAARLGLPVTQFVKHLIIKEVEHEEYPTYQMSERTEEKLKEAMKQKDKAVKVDDVSKFFKNL